MVVRIVDVYEHTCVRCHVRFSYEEEDLTDTGTPWVKCPSCSTKTYHWLDLTARRKATDD